MDIQTILRDMQRPKILVRAARISLDMAECEGQPMPRREPLARLVDREQALENLRRAGRTGYNPRAHVRVLSELLAEARKAPPTQA